MKRPSFPIRHILALAALALTLPIAACSSVLGEQSEPAIGGTTMDDTSVLPFDESMVESGDAMPQDTGGTQAERSIVKSGSISIEVEALEPGVHAVTDIARSFGGTVASQHVSEYVGSSRTGYVSIDVPAEHFDDAFTKLAELGTVRSDERSTDDVTTEHVDLKARVAALQTSVDRLQDLLSSAASTSDLLEIESMLSERQANLDGLEAQLQALEGRVADSNIQVMLTEPSVLPGGGPQSFWDALGVGLASIGSFAASAVIVLGVILPWLVIFAIIAAAIVIPLRIRKRRRSATPSPTESVANSPED